ncbi:acyltransferase 3 [Penicillium malachiteum]|nr:acyltransferase 3 [Penicillium malachiteum]
MFSSRPTGMMLSASGAAAEARETDDKTQRAPALSQTLLVRASGVAGSGYAVSIPIIASRDEHALNLRFFHRICSASTRRVLRIYLPNIRILFISHLLYFMSPWKEPLSHIVHVLRRILHLLDVTNKCINNNSGSCIWDNNNITFQLWTMPIEFRGSCVVYLLILTLAHWMRRPRLFALALVAWDLFCFVAGLFLAERDIGLVPLHEGNGEIELPCHSGNAAQTTFTKLRLACGKISGTKSFHRVCTASCFILGNFFLSMTHNDVGKRLCRQSTSFCISFDLPTGLTLRPYPGNHPRMFITAWAGSGMICGLIFVVLSEIWYRFVDLKYLEIGRQFEKWVTHEIHR